MKRFLSFVCLLCLFSSLIVAKVAADNDCELYIDIHSDENLIRATYDMDIFLDGEYLGTVANGEYYTELVEVDFGKHELEVCNANDNSINATKKFKIDSDMTLSTLVKHSKKSIEFSNFKTNDSIIGHELEVPSVVNMTLSEASSELQKIGFVNYHATADSGIWDYNNWLVMSQSEDDGSILDKNDYISLECISLDDYFSDRYVGRTLNEVEKDAALNHFALKYKSSEKISDFEQMIKSLDQAEKPDWIVETARQYGGASRTAVLTLRNGSGAVTSTVDRNTSSSNRQTATASTPLPTPVQAIAITAPALYAAYENNEVSADKTYKGKIVEVSGTVGSISSSFGSYSVSLKADEWGITSIECSFNKEHVDDLATLNSGDYVTIRGTCDGMMLAWVYCSKCQVVK